MSAPKKVLLVVTSHDALGSTGNKTGFWLEELAAPYYVFTTAGFAVAIASPQGGQPPVDPGSLAPQFTTDATRRFQADAAAQALLANTVKLADVAASSVDAVFIVGGHGVLFDVAVSPAAKALFEAVAAAGKPLAAVCHGPAALAQLQDSTGAPLVRGKKVTGFSNSEEALIQLSAVVPIAIETAFKEQGGLYAAGPDFAPHAIRDGTLITGQNPASSEATAAHLAGALAAADNDTIFGKILRGEIPAKIAYEDEHCIAFHDVSPVAPTHVLIIPRRLIPKLSDAKSSDAALLGHLMLAAGEVARKLGVGEAFRLVINNGAVVGQSVFHLHMHLIAGRELTWPPG